jgi:hypothetical protein
MFPENILLERLQGILKKNGYLRKRIAGNQKMY